MPKKVVFVEKNKYNVEFFFLAAPQKSLSLMDSP